METKSLTSILTLFFQLSNDLHWHHLNTKSFAEHKALEFAYEKILGYKDTIAEQLIPFEGKLTTMKLLSIPSSKCAELPTDIVIAAEALCELAEAKGYDNIENLSAEIIGVAAKLKYLLNLV
jgi:DNA-binding ferritin-like protein